MARAIIALIFAAFSVSFAFKTNYFYGLALFMTLFVSLLIGIPALLVMKHRKLDAWWQAMLIGALIPIMLLLTGSPTYISVLMVSLGLAGGLIVWIIGIYRNPTFASPQQKFPLIILLTPFGSILIMQYLEALEPRQVYGCITDYQPAKNPTAWNHSFVTAITDNGDEYRDGLTVGSSSPEVLGRCAWGEITPSASLRSFTFNILSTNAKGCRKKCPNQEQ